MQATRDGFGEGVVAAGQADSQVVVLTGDLTESTRVEEFKKRFPERFIECGVAEQNMLGIAAGLALSGKVPFVCSFAVFSPGRNWEQLRLAVAYSQANVKIVGSHAGLLTGPDGASHQALEDLALTRVLPNLTVVVPADAREAQAATLAAAAWQGPVYLRLCREKTPVFTPEKTTFSIGAAQVARPGKEITLIACGALVYESVLAAQMLQKQGVSCEVINCSTIKPLDKITLLTSVQKTGKAVTIEDHQVTGGLGGAVAELLAEEMPTPLLRIGMPDQFGESGPPLELLAKYGLNKEGIARRITERFL
jgi:transketolase